MSPGLRVPRIAVLLLSLAPVTLAGAEVYSVVPIPLAPTAAGCDVADISNTGEIVGTMYFQDGSRGFSWKTGEVVLLAIPAGHVGSGAAAVNDLGEIVGSTNDEFGIPKSAHWLFAADPSPLVLESSGGRDANVYTTGINNAGVISGYYTGSGSGNTSSWRAVKWVPDGDRLRQSILITGVSPLPDGVFHAAYGINNLNIVVGTGAWLDPNLLTSQAAIRWSATDVPDELQTLPDHGFAPRYQAVAINDTGVAIGTIVSNTGQAQAIAWQPDLSVVDLGVRTGFTESEPLDINASGAIVGRHFDGVTSVAAIYDAGSWADLNTRLVDAAGWSLQSAVGINDAGRIIGTGLLNGIPRAFLLIPLIPQCDLPGDVTGDGVLDGRDVQNFLDCLIGGSVAPGCSCGDFNGGGLATDDISQFVSALVLR